MPTVVGYSVQLRHVDSFVVEVAREGEEGFVFAYVVGDSAHTVLGGTQEAEIAA